MNLGQYFSNTSIATNLPGNSIMKWNILSYILSQYFSNTTICLFYNNDTIVEVSKIASVISPKSQFVIYNDGDMKYAHPHREKTAKSQHFIILPGKRFNESLKSWRYHPMWNPRGRLIILPASQDGSDEDEVYRFLTSAWVETRASNAVVVLPDGQVYAWTPQGTSDCQYVRTVTRPRLKEMFSGKPNMQGCPLRTAAAPSPLYSFQNVQGSFEHGIAVKMISIISQQYGMVPTYVEGTYSESENYFTLQDKNGSLAGVMTLLDTHFADIAISALAVTSNRFYSGEALFPFTLNGVHWFVQSAKRKNYVFYFDRSVSAEAWGVVLLFFGCIVVGSYLGVPRMSLSDSLLRSLATFFNYPVPDARVTSANLLTLLMYVWALHLFIAFQTTLLKNLIVPQMEKPVSSMEEGLDLGMKFNLLPSLAYLYNKSEPVWDILLSSNKFSFSEDLPQLLADIAEHGDSMALLPELTGKALARAYNHVGSNRKTLVAPLKDSFLSLYGAMYMYNGHPMWPAFQNSTLGLLSGGIPQYWLTHYLNDTTSPAYQVETNIVSISIRHLNGVFVAIISLHTLAFVIFLAELSYFRFKKQWHEALGNTFH